MAELLNILLLLLLFSNETNDIFRGQQYVWSLLPLCYGQYIKQQFW